MQEIEDLEKKMGTENVAESAMGEERGGMDRRLDIRQARLEVQDLCDAVASAAMDIVSAQGLMAQAEGVIDEIQHRLDDLLKRLRKAEKEDDR